MTVGIRFHCIEGRNLIPAPSCSACCTHKLLNLELAITHRQWCGTLGHWRSRIIGSKCTTSAGGKSCGATGEPLLVCWQIAGDSVSLMNSLLQLQRRVGRGGLLCRQALQAQQVVKGTSSSIYILGQLSSPFHLLSRLLSSTRKRPFSSWDSGTGTANHMPLLEKQVQQPPYQK